MSSEIDQFSSFLRRMSASDKSQVFLNKKQDDRKDIIKHDNSSQPTSENLGYCPAIVSEAQTAEEEKEKGNLDIADHQQNTEEVQKEEEKDKARISHTESEKYVSEDDDGFKTPTSSNHRIPATMQCPPAPKKTRPQQSKLKRKVSPPPGASRSLQLDPSTAEVGSIFLLINPNDQDNTQEQKMKKARTDDKDQS